MTTIRVAKRTRYAVIDRRSVNDKGLSFRARGVLVWLLDKPDDWTVNTTAMAAEGTEGRDAIRGAIKELEDAGYLVRERKRHDDGTFTWVTNVYEFPPTMDGKPVPGQPSTVNQASNKVLIPKTETESTNTAPATAGRPKSPERVMADAIVKAWWDWAKERTGSPPTAQNYIGVVKIIERLLKAGFTDREIKQALIDCPTVSIGWMESTIKKQREQRGAPRPLPKGLAAPDDDPEPDRKAVARHLDWEARQAARASNG